MVLRGIRGQKYQEVLTIIPESASSTYQQDAAPGQRALPRERGPQAREGAVE